MAGTCIALAYRNNFVHSPTLSFVPSVHYCESFGGIKNRWSCKNQYTLFWKCFFFFFGFVLRFYVHFPGNEHKLNAKAARTNTYMKMSLCKYFSINNFILSNETKKLFFHRKNYSLWRHRRFKQTKRKLAKLQRRQWPWRKHTIAALQCH